MNNVRIFCWFGDVTPCEGEGVEMRHQSVRMVKDMVTPCEGVGVEMIYKVSRIYVVFVTPCEGVGVEM